MFYCLQYTVFTFQEYFGIHSLNFSYVPPMPLWHPTPLIPPPPVHESSSQELYYCRSAWPVISLLVRLMFFFRYTPTRGIWWPRTVLHKVNMHVVILLVRLTWAQMYPLQTFPRAFLISDEKLSSLQVVLWCHKTSDWWCTDIHKLVWREHSMYNISLHCM